MNLFSNTPPQDSRELWRHFSKTYMSLRGGLVLLAFSMPFVLYLWGKFGHGLDLQPSMSAYFWAANEGQCATFPMRTFFVAYLAMIGVGLFAYKGLTNLENSLLNASAICAFVVAIYPERMDVKEAINGSRLRQLFDNCPAVESWARLDTWPVHFTAAVILFVLLAAVSWFCAEKSLKYLPPDRDAEKFRKSYKGIAIVMSLFPLVGFAVAFLLKAWSDRIFFVETAGVVTFGVYWLVKTYELYLSSLEIDPEGAVRKIMKQ